MKPATKHAINTLALGALCFTNCLFIHTFLIAYGNPDKSVNVMIDSYHEANFELFVIIPLNLLAVVWGVIMLIKEYKSINGGETNGRTGSVEKGLQSPANCFLDSDSSCNLGGDTSP